MDNKLKTVSYDEFVKEMLKKPCRNNPTLAYSASIFLIRSGFGSSLLASILSFTFLIWIIVAIIGLFIWGPISLFFILLSPIQFKYARKVINQVVWDELLGIGKIEKDVREKTYNSLVQSDMLFASFWINH